MLHTARFTLNIAWDDDGMKLDALSSRAGGVSAVWRAKLIGLAFGIPLFND